MRKPERRIDASRQKTKIIASNGPVKRKMDEL